MAGLARGQAHGTNLKVLKEPEMVVVLRLVGVGTKKLMIRESGKVGMWGRVQQKNTVEQAVKFLIGLVLRLVGVGTKETMIRASIFLGGTNQRLLKEMVEPMIKPVAGAKELKGGPNHPVGLNLVMRRKETLVVVSQLLVRGVAQEQALGAREVTRAAKEDGD